MKNILGLFILSCLLTSCDYDTKITTTETSIRDDSAISIGKNSKAIAVHEGDLNHHSKEDSNTSSYITHGNNSPIINGEKNNSNSNSITYGNNSAIINGTNNVIVYSSNKNNSNIVMNGNEFTFKNDNKIPAIEIIPTGKKTKLILPNNLIYDLQSILPIKQLCSTHSDNYLEVDEALIPYINQEKLQSGIIQILPNNYHSSQTQALTFNLITTPLSQIKTNGVGDVSVNCISPNRFIWSDNATGNKKLLNVNSKFVQIEHNGIGDFKLYQVQIDNLVLHKTAVGNFKTDGNINTVNIDNSGIGNVYIKKANNAVIKLNKSGIGDITVDGQDQSD